jgi:hypothetical protein
VRGLSDHLEHTYQPASTQHHEQLINQQPCVHASHLVIASKAEGRVSQLKFYFNYSILMVPQSHISQPPMVVLSTVDVHARAQRLPEVFEAR